MKKLFTFLALTLCAVGSAWADEVTVGRTLAFETTPTDYTIVSKTNATTTKADGAGAKTGTKKEVQLNGTKKTINAPCYRSIQSDNSTALLSYQKTSYLGFQTVIADGYRLTVSSIAAQVAVNNQFTYKIVIEDEGGNVVYESADKTGTTSGANNPSITPSGLVLSGTVQVKMFYYNSGNEDKSKYIVPLNFTITGELETASSYTVSTSVNGDGSVTGAGSYVDGTKATLIATPGATIFDHWSKASDAGWSSTDNPLQVVVTANETYTAHFIAATTYNITGAIASGQESYGSITNSGVNIVVEDGEITFVATPNAGYAFVKWQKDGVDFETSTSITVSSTADATYTAFFSPLFTVTYVAGAGSFGTQTDNKLVTTIYADKDGSITTWRHGYAGYEGYTQTGWNDGVNNYGFNEAITIDANTVLTATWKSNVESLNVNAESIDVTWAFNNTAMPDLEINGKTGYSIATAEINGKTIDMPMLIDATGSKAKFYNVGRSGNAQINANTVLTIPAVKNMVITINCSEENVLTASNTTVGGENTTLVGNKQATYTYTGSASTITIELNGGRYYDNVTVAYPATAIAAIISVAEYATFVPSENVSVPEGVTANTVTVVGSTANLNSISDIPAGVPVVLNGANGTYYFPIVATTSSDVTGNELHVSATDVTADGTQYVLAKPDDKEIGFYKAASSTTIAAGKAYLVSPSGAPCFVFNFDGSATGIEAVEAAKSFDGAFYNLAGQRVSQPTRGLYIVNGKKVVIK